MTGKWYCIRKVGQGVVRTDEVIEQKKCGYMAQWSLSRPGQRTSEAAWHTFNDSTPGTWDEAWAVLEKHANQMELADNFVGTF